MCWFTLILMAEMTQILAALDAGDNSAASALFPLVYDQLRKLAAYHMSKESSEHTLQPTALVNEAFLRLVTAESGDTPISFTNRKHFFLTASEAMRRILIDHARGKHRIKRGGELQRMPLEDVGATLTDPSELLVVNEYLEKFAEKWPRRAELMKLRIFAGCTILECGELLGISASTAEDDWTYGRAWLGREWMKAEKVADTAGD
jgi:RNA polymerase sigma factor (TIGR02999 family)